MTRITWCIKNEAHQKTKWTYPTECVTIQRSVRSLMAHSLIVPCVFSAMLMKYGVYPLMICKRCSFECDIGKYSTCSMNKVWAFRRTLYSWNMCCIFPYFTRSCHTWHNCHRFEFKLQLECDMGWYRHTSHSENHPIECEKKMYHILQYLLSRLDTDSRRDTSWYVYNA